MRQFFYSDTLCWLISSRSSIASSGAIDGLFKKIIQNKEHSVICNTSYNNITVFTHFLILLNNKTCIFFSVPVYSALSPHFSSEQSSPGLTSKHCANSCRFFLYFCLNDMSKIHFIPKKIIYIC